MYLKIVSTWIFKLDVSKTWYIVRQTFAKLWKIDINFIQACHIISWKFLTEKSNKRHYDRLMKNICRRMNYLVSMIKNDRFKAI